MKRSVIVCLLLCTSAIQALAATDPAVVWLKPAGTLGGSCGVEKPTLQEAIDTVIDGGAVHILSGIVLVGDAARGVITNKEVSILGGFQNCTSLTRDGLSVLDGSGATSDNALIKISNTGSTPRDITIADLEMTGNTHSAVGSGRGGALEIWGSQSLDITLQNLQIHANEAYTGGGVFIAGQPGSKIREVQLKSTLVYDNVAQRGGGGIECGLGSMRISPGSHVGVAPDGQPAGNFSAFQGGGIFLTACNVVFESSAGQPLKINNNRTAQGDGGGLYVSADTYSSAADLVQITGGEVEFANNSVGMGSDTSSSGGAIYLGSGRLFMDGGSLRNNSAKGDGGAIAVSSSNSYAWFGYSEMDPSWDCTAPGLGCVQISGNSAYRGGGVFSVYSKIDLLRVVMDGNRSRYRGSAAYVVGNQAEINFKHTAVINSEAYDDGTLARYALQADSNSKITFDYSTLAHGVQGSFSGSVPPIAATNGASFEADSSIIWNNHGNKVAEATGTVTITNSIVPFAYGSSNLVADPLFMDPNGFHISALSPAIDIGTDTIDRDIDRQSRGGTNATDAGADEADGNRVGILGAGCEFETLSEALAAGLLAYTNPLDFITLRAQPGVYPEHLIIPANRRVLIEVAEQTTCSQNDPSASPWAVIIQGGNTWARGGVIELKDGARLILKNLTLFGGKATLGGNMYIATGADVQLYNTQVFGGTATSKGGGVRVFGGTLKLNTGSKIAGNQVTGNGGGIMVNSGFVYLYDNSQVGDTGSVNESSSQGGGIYLSASELYMYDSARVMAGRAINGGGVYATSDSLVQLNDSASIGAGSPGSNNVATSNGGGIYLTGSGTALTMLPGSGLNYGSADGSGGGAYLGSGAQLTASGVSLYGNSAQMGGGIYIGGSSSAIPSVDIDFGTIQNNSATGRGGAVFTNWGTVEMNHVRMNGNSATGGAILESENSDSNLTNTLIYANSGSDLFGLGPASNATLHASTLIADATDAAFYTAADAGNISIIGSIFSGFTDTATGPGSILGDTCSMDSTGEMGTNMPILFLNPNTQNYHLTLSSPAIDRCVTGPATDLDNNPRPAIGNRAKPYDAGAYEYQAPPTPYTLSVVVQGSGTVTSLPAGIDCGNDCSGSFNNNTAVTLSAAPDSGYVFSNWSGSCTGSGSCVVIMTGNKTVTALFSIAEESIFKNGFE